MHQSHSFPCTPHVNLQIVRSDASKSAKQDVVRGENESESASIKVCKNRVMDDRFRGMPGEEEEKSGFFKDDDFVVDLEDELGFALVC